MRLAASILLGGALALVLAAGPSAAGERTPKPVIERATQGTQCVEPVDYMRRHHMDLLKHQRDDTVHGGIRGAKHSLKGCIDCHASAQSQSVAKQETNFCVSCHSYAAVKIDCFGCHATQPQALVLKGKP
jgi:predicted CXXCH cytochrome family protein